MKRHSNSKPHNSRLENATVGEDVARVVESLGREAQSKMVWKTLPQGVNNVR